MRVDFKPSFSSKLLNPFRDKRTAPLLSVPIQRFPPLSSSRDVTPFGQTALNCGASRLAGSLFKQRLSPTPTQNAPSDVSSIAFSQKSDVKPYFRVNLCSSLGS